jgi:peptide/nickel transport system ATP-binding protein
MRDGEIVEQGPTDQILHHARHPYTAMLLTAVQRKPTAGAIAPPLPNAVSKTASATAASGRPILKVDAVSASYAKPGFLRGPAEVARALHPTSLHLNRNETLAIVGESGSGKSTLARVIAGLHAPLEGSVELAGEVLAGRAGGRSREQLRRVQIIFQSPELSLNPRQSVGDAIGRALNFYLPIKGQARHDRVSALLQMVGLQPDFAARMPQELSGGQRQRVSIARAFAAQPDIVLCDEILSALDSVVAARILDLIRNLQRDSGACFIFISHDLATVAAIADRVAVMYAGRIMELAPTSELFRAPQHPYTRLLLQSMPELRRGWLESIPSDSGPAGTPRLGAATGCPFQPRCPRRTDLCERELPELRAVTESERLVACHFPALDGAVTLRETTIRTASE